MQGRLELYTRRGCHLCGVLHEQAQPIAERHGFVIETVDIDRDPDLAARHHTRIPVLLLDGREICHHFLDADALEQALTRATAG
jgi:glutaredoxin